MLESIYYVYRYIDPRNNNVIYVGKGKKDRAFIHLHYKTNIHLHRKINKIRALNLEPIVEFVCKNVTEEFAHHVERALIKLHGRVDLKTGTLCNMTDGGEGVSGLIISEEARKRMSYISSHISDETRKRISEGLKRSYASGSNRLLWDPEVRARWSKSLSDARKGMDFSEEHRANISKGLKEYYANNEHRNCGHLGKISSETREQMSNSAKENRKNDRLTCPHCGKEGPKSNMIQSHFDNCPKNPNFVPVVCPHCGKEGKNKNAMKQWHFDNCKHKK